MAVHTSEQVQLLFTQTHSVLYSKLSFNVLREVCSYIGFRFLPIVLTYECSFVILHDLGTDTRTNVFLSQSLPEGLVYCRINEFTLFGVGGVELRLKSALQVEFHTGIVRFEPDMTKARRRPGVLCFDSRVFVFGGWSATGPTLKTCEAFSLSTKEWVHCPDMLLPKAGFTPVAYCRDIYLPATELQQLEVFTPANNCYRLLPLRFQDGSVESVSFVYEEELITVTFSKKIYEWRLGSQESSARIIGNTNRNYSGLCSGHPVRFGDFEYWANYLGKLVKFSLKDKILYEP